MRAFAICNDCPERVELHQMKDFESFANSEIAEHYEAKHRERISRLSDGTPFGIPYTRTEFTEDDGVTVLDD